MSEYIQTINNAVSFIGTAFAWVVVIAMPIVLIVALVREFIWPKAFKSKEIKRLRELRDELSDALSHSDGCVVCPKCGVRSYQRLWNSNVRACQNTACGYCKTANDSTPDQSQT